MSELSDIQDPLVRPKRSVGVIIGLGVAGLMGSFVGQVILGVLLITLAPFCSIPAYEDDDEDIIEMAIVEEPVEEEPEIEEEEPAEEEIEEEEPEPVAPEPEPKEKEPEPKEEEKLEEVETEEDVKEEAAPPELLEGLTMDSTSTEGDFSIKVGKGIKSGKMNEKYVDPNNLDKIKTKEGGTGDGIKKKAPKKQCKDVKATVKKRVKGEYPLQAQRRRLEGIVVGIVTVNPSGKVTKVKIVKGAGHGFDESAEAAFKKWLFNPAEKNCEKVTSEVRVNNTFTLE